MSNNHVVRGVQIWISKNFETSDIRIFDIRNFRIFMDSDIEHRYMS